MNRNRWLIALLLLSWTLNVALVVALLTRRDFLPAPPPPPFAESAPPGKPHWEPDETFLATAKPLQMRRHDLMCLMGELFASDTLDSARIRRIGDSLETVRSELQRSFTDQMMRRHQRLSPEERQEFHRMMTARGDSHRWGRRGHKYY